MWQGVLRNALVVAGEIELGQSRARENDTLRVADAHPGDVDPLRLAQRLSLLFEVPLSCEPGDDGLLPVLGLGGFVPPVEVDPGTPICPEVSLPDEVVPEVEDVLEPSRGCASADDGRERCELRPCAFFERLAFLVTDDEVELVSSLVFPAITASSLPAELFEVKSGVASLRR